MYVLIIVLLLKILIAPTHFSWTRYEKRRVRWR